MQYYKIGYVPNAVIPDVTPADVGKLTHINLAFGLVENGLLDTHKLTHIDAIQNFKRWNPQLKVILSVGGWGAGGFSTMALTAEGRRAFAASCLAYVQQHQLDGIDIDWEYPCNDAAGIDANPRDRENFTLLLQALRDALGPDRIVSIAAGAGEYFIRDTEINKVASLVDYVQVMTYDMRNGNTTQAGHHAALGSSAGDDKTTSTRYIMDLFHNAGVPSRKLIVGIAFYGRTFTGVPNVNHGLLQPAGSVGNYGPAFSEITEDFLREGHFTQYWDEQAEASYLWNGRDFISFESAEAVRRKCAYAKEKGFLGVMYWQHGSDTTRALLTVIDKTL